MVRLTRNVFTDLAIWMIGFGILIGVIFPFFIAFMGVPSRFVFTPWFFFTCISAGILVGAVNIGLARTVIGRRLQGLSKSMASVEANLRILGQVDDLERRKPETYFIDVDSDDEIGDSARAFNNLIEALMISHEEASSEANKLKAMIEGMEQGIVVTNADGIITEVNEWLLERGGTNRKDIIGKRLLDTSPKTQGRELIRAVLEGYRSGRTQDSCEIDAELLGVRARTWVQPIFKGEIYKGTIVNLIDIAGMTEVKGKIITLVCQLTKHGSRARDIAVESVKRITGKDFSELDPEGWYDSQVLAALFKGIEDHEDIATLAWATIKVMGKEVYPTIATTVGLPEQMRTPQGLLRFESQQFVDNHRGYGVAPRKVTTVEPGHIVIEAFSPGYNCFFIEGVFDGILGMCDIKSRRVIQKECVKKGDPHCEYDITWQLV